MIQLHLLSGKQAGTKWVARRFPVRIGRELEADLRLVEDGVWEKHLELKKKSAEGIFLVAHPETRTSVNGEEIQEVRLRNGDVISLGAMRLQFWLSESEQSGLAWREWLVWAMIAGVSLAQVALVYWLQA